MNKIFVLILVFLLSLNIVFGAECTGTIQTTDCTTLSGSECYKYYQYTEGFEFYNNCLWDVVDQMCWDDASCTPPVAPPPGSNIEFNDCDNKHDLISNTNYTLTSDVETNVVSPDIFCFGLKDTEASLENIVFDCQGHTISKGTSNKGVFLFRVATLDNLTIKNCNFEDIEEPALFIYDTYGLDGILIYNNTFNQTSALSEGAILIEYAYDGSPDTYVKNINISKNIFNITSFYNAVDFQGWTNTKGVDNVYVEDNDFIETLGDAFHISTRDTATNFNNINIKRNNFKNVGRNAVKIEQILTSNQGSMTNLLVSDNTYSSVNNSLAFFLNQLPVSGDIYDDFSNTALNFNGDKNPNIKFHQTGQKTVDFKEDNTSTVSLEWDFDQGALDMSQVSIEKEPTTAPQGYTIVDFSNVNPIIGTKTIYVNSITPPLGQTQVCVKNAPVTHVNEFSTNCDGTDETLFDDCFSGQTLNGLTCSYVSESQQYKITGLTYSAVKEGVNEKLIVYDSADESQQDCDTVVTVYANFTDVDTGLKINNAVCNVTFEDSSFFDLVDNVINYYNDTKSFSLAGEYAYNITCNAPGYNELTAENNITIAGIVCEGGSFPEIPEFSLSAVVLTIIIVGLGLIFVTRRKRQAKI